jgi:transcriptional repressor NrdR
MQCKGCGYSQTHVVYTRHNEKTKGTRRRRECMRCGLRFTTQEETKEPLSIGRPSHDFSRADKK